MAKLAGGDLKPAHDKNHTDYTVHVTVVFVKGPGGNDGVQRVRSTNENNAVCWTYL